MTINDNIFELISELEYIISNETLSKSAFLGAGISDAYDYRYPVRISLDGNQEESKTQVRDKVHDYCETWTKRDELTNERIVTKIVKPTPDVIKTMYYAFGAHRLYIGDALKKVLEFLENRYNIDFNELEAKVKNKQ